MPTLIECLQAKADEGLIDDDTLKRLRKDYADARKQASDERQAGNLVRARELERTATRRADKMQQTLTNLRIRQAWERARADGFKMKDLGQLFFTLDKQRRRAAPTSIETAQERIRGNVHAKMADFLVEARPTVFGGTRKAISMKNIVREMMGEDTGDDVAKRLGQSLREGQRHVVHEFRRAGGHMPFLENRGPAQIWSRDKLKELERRQGREQAKQQFADDIMPMLDRDEMLDNETGLPMDDGRLREVLFRMFDKITHPEEQMDTTTGFFPAKSISAEKSQERVLKFRDADTWLRAQEKYGSADSEAGIYDTIIRDFEDTIDEAALVEVLGPQPDAGVRQIKNLMRAEGVEDSFFASIDGLYNGVTGKHNAPEREMPARAMHLFRSTTNAAALGGAFISSITDLPTSIFANAVATGSRVRGPLRIIGRSAEKFAAASDEDKKQAIRLGLTANSLTNRINDMNRLALDEYQFMRGATGIAQKINQGVMRLSLLTRWTDTQRWTFQTEMLSEITRNSNRPFDQLPRQLQRTFEARNIDAGDWDAIRSEDSMMDVPGFGRLIHPERSARFAPEATRKLQDVLVEEARFAVPTPGVKEHTTLSFNAAQAGTFAGEVARTATMLKSFPVTMMALQGSRAFGEIRKTRGYGPMLGYLSGLTLAGTGVGMLAEQIDGVVSGQEPRPIDRDLILDGMARAGTMGLFSDVIFGQVSRFGLGSFLLGPAFDVGERGYAFGESVVEAASTEEFWRGDIGEAFGDADAGRKLLDFTDKVNPAGSLWWTQLMLERAIADNVQRAVDPEAERSFQRAEQWVEEERDTSFFLPPGALDASELLE